MATPDMASATSKSLFRLCLYTAGMTETLRDVVSRQSSEAMGDPILAALYGYWNRVRRSKAVPARSDLDPVDIPHLLPYLLLVECYDSGQRINFRLVGTDVAFGADPTGKFLQDAAPAGVYATHITELYQFAANSDKALFSSYSYGYTADSGPSLIKRLFLPLTGMAEIPKMMLVGQIRDKSSHITHSAWQAAPGQIERRALFEIGAAAENPTETGDAEVPDKMPRPPLTQHSQSA